MTANTFIMRSWTEQIVNGADDEPRIAHAHATFAYDGLIEGTSVCDYLINYAADGSDAGASTGLERIEGTVGGRKGSFVIKHDVAFEGHAVLGSWSVVPGSGTGDLAGLTGDGTIAGSSETMTYTFTPR